MIFYCATQDVQLAHAQTNDTAPAPWNGIPAASTSKRFASVIHVTTFGNFEDGLSVHRLADVLPDL